MDALEAHDPVTIGRYRLIARLGAGGMGRVYLARSAGGMPVALKVIHEHYAQDPGFRERFRREVATARAVSGAFTAPVIDADPDAPAPWLVTAFLPGLSLQEAVAAHGPFPLRAVYALAAGLAEGIESIHRAGVVHRDLKPHNVLLGPDGPRVIDFGIARAAQDSALTRPGGLLGSPGYMSPEQARGQEIGPPSDIFSLGAVLTYAATGQGPFGRGSAAERIVRIRKGQADLSGVGDHGLRELIAMCLRQDSRDRPTAGQLLDRLALHGAAPHGLGWLPQPVAAAITQVRTPAPPQTGPNRRQLLLIGGVGAVGLAATVITAVQAARPDPGLATTPSPSPTPTDTPGGPTLTPGTVPEGRLSWDYQAKYTGPPIVAGALLIVPAVGELRALDARTGEHLWRKDEYASRALIVDDQVLFHGTSNFGLADVASGKIRWTYDEPYLEVTDPAVGADTVYYIANTAQSVKPGKLKALDLRTGAVRWSHNVELPSNTSVLGHGVTVGGDTLYVWADALHAYTLDGQPRWRISLGKAWPPLVVQDTVYLVTGDLRLRAIRAGKELWSCRVSYPSGPPAVIGDQLFVAGRDLLHVVDRNSGKVNWTMAVQAVQGVTAAGGLVYTAGEHRLSVLDPAGPRVLWRAVSTERIDAHPVPGGGLVYLSHEHRITAWER
jgi:outer membrane protein assembly factor BamB